MFEPIKYKEILIDQESLGQQENPNYEILNPEALNNRIRGCSENILKNICECGEEPCADIEPFGDIEPPCDDYCDDANFRF